MRWSWLILLVACSSSTPVPATTPEENAGPTVSPQMGTTPTVEVTARPPATAAPGPTRREELTVGPAPPPPQPPGAPTAAATTDTTKVERELASMRARLRGCYNAALTQQPDLTGTTRWKLSVDADGTVSKAVHDCPDKLPADFTQCVSRSLRGLSLPRDGVAYEMSFGTCQAP